MADESLAQQQRLDALDRLTPDERIAYDQFVRKGGTRLSVVVQKTMFDLYVHGLSVEDLLGLNPLLEKGAIVAARVEGLWDARKDAYIAEVLAEVPAKLRLTAAEAISFMSLQLQVAHRMQGEKLRRYLTTGDPKELDGGFHIESFKSYKSCIESLAKLLEASTPKRPDQPTPFQPTPGQGDHGAGGADPLQGGSRFTPGEADEIRAALERKRGG